MVKVYTNSVKYLIKITKLGSCGGRDGSAGDVEGGEGPEGKGVCGREYGGNSGEEEEFSPDLTKCRKRSDLDKYDRYIRKHYWEEKTDDNYFFNLFSFVSNARSRQSFE